MASTYEPIATTTLGSAAASYTFSSISSAYTDLILVINGAGAGGGGGNVTLKLNGDTGANYSYTRLLGDGSSPESSGSSNAGSMGVGDNASGERIELNIQFNNYSNSTTYKTVLSRSSSQSFVSAYVGLYRSTSAISSITFAMNNQNIASGTTLSLYGIKAA